MEERELPADVVFNPLADQVDLVTVLVKNVVVVYYLIKRGVI